MASGKTNIDLIGALREQHPDLSAPVEITGIFTLEQGPDGLPELLLVEGEAAGEKFSRRVRVECVWEPAQPPCSDRAQAGNSRLPAPPRAAHRRGVRGGVQEDTRRDLNLCRGGSGPHVVAVQINAFFWRSHRGSAGKSAL